MIVDTHYHLMPQVTEKVANKLAKYPLYSAKLMGKEISRETIIEAALETWGDSTGEKLIAYMEEEGIDVTVILMVDDTRDNRVTVDGIIRGNKIVTDVARRYPGKVIPLVGMDPRRPEGPDLLRQCFEEFGARGLKYHPDFGYDPGGPDSYKLLEIVNDNKGVLLTHAGPLDPPSRCKFSDPLLLADIAVDFPEIKVIAAHMGFVNWRPWAALAMHQPNLYGDLAMWDVFAFGKYDFFCRELRDILDCVGASKVLFATDNPIYNVVEPAKNFIKLIKDLPTKAPGGIHFTEDEVKAILGENAASVFGL